MVIDVLFNGLFTNLPVDIAKELLRSVDTELCNQYVVYAHNSAEPDNHLSGDTSRILSSLQLDSTQLQSYAGTPVFVELNKITLRKDAFSRYKENFSGILKRYRHLNNHSDDNNNQLIETLLILSNIGDSAISLENYVLPYTQMPDNNVSYLAKKCVINMHLSFNGTYTTIDPHYFESNDFQHFILLSDELNEGLPTISALQQSFDYDFFPRKIYLKQVLPDC